MSEIDFDIDVESSDFPDNNIIFLVDEDVFLEISINSNNYLAWLKRIPVMYCENGDRIYNIYFQKSSVQRIRMTPNQWHDEMQIVPIVRDILEKMGRK